jgi:hypothetical protein
MANIILYKRSDTINKIPNSSNLQDGELAINTSDGRIYLNNSTMSIPVGTIQDGYLSNNSDWLPCNGNKYLKSQYQSLANYLSYEVSITNNISNPTDSFLLLSSAHNGSVCCVVGYTDTVYISTDFINWSKINHPVTGRWSHIIWTGSVFFVASESNNSYMTSPDGINWTAGTIAGLSAIRAITWNGSIYSASTLNTNLVYTSTDGINWISQTLPLTLRYRSAISLGNIILIFPDTGSTYIRSTDGINWTAYSFPSNLKASGQGIYPVIFKNKIYSPGDNGCAVSEDGITWTQINGLNGVFITPNSQEILYFISTSNDIFYSTDGNNWKILQSHIGHTRVLTISGGGSAGVAFNNSLYTGTLFTLNANTDYFSTPKLLYNNSQPRYIKT